MNLFNIFVSNKNLSTETIIYLRTKYSKFVNDGKKRNDWKNYFVTLNVTQTGCQKCKELAKHVYVDNVFANGKPTLGYQLLSNAISQGALMDSCHTSVLTYFPGINMHPRLRNFETKMDNATNALEMKNR